MSIPINSLCYQSNMAKTMDQARTLGDSDTATAFAKELLNVYLSMPADASSAHFGPITNDLLKQYYNLGPDRFQKEKEDSNRFVLERLEMLTQQVTAQVDPVLAGLQFSILGNYLDFSALYGQVSFQKLDEMLDDALKMPLDMDIYRQLLSDFENGKKLLYITDNAGEIGFDRIFAQQIHKKYPHLEITFMVRGQLAQNDATREDAAIMGIEFPVIDNGNALAGTDISLLSKEAKCALDDADVIIAKGMGNTETMYGCGYNVYYAFLVKCVRFVEFFNQPMMTPMIHQDPNAKN